MKKILSTLLSLALLLTLVACATPNAKNDSVDTVDTTTYHFPGEHEIHEGTCLFGHTTTA